MDKIYSFTLKGVDRDLFWKARAKALSERRTITAVIVELLTAWLAGDA